MTLVAQSFPRHTHTMGGLPVLAFFAPLVRQEDPLFPLKLKRLLTHSKQRGVIIFPSF